MKKWVGIILVIILIVGVALLLTHKNSSPAMNMSHMGSSMSKSPVGGHPEEVMADQVKISNFSFSPGTILVKKGTKVTWTNQDSVAHNVKENDGRDGPKSQTLKQGESYSFTFEQAGTFNYICSIHPDVKGTVVVTE